MLALEHYGDTTRVRMSTPVTRSMGYTSSAYFARGLLVDTGFSNVAREFMAWVSQARPAGVLLTHHHEDHSGNLGLLARAGIPIAAADATLRAVRAMEPLILYHRAFWGTPSPLPAELPRFTPAGLALVSTPGHTRDHHVVWDAERATLFSGDLFLGVKVRAAQNTEEIPRLVESLRAMIALGPRRMFCAHRGLVPDPVGALAAKVTWLEALMGDAGRLAREGLSDREITSRLLGREGATAWVTRGEVSKVNLIRSALLRGGQQSTVNNQQSVRRT